MRTRSKNKKIVLGIIFVACFIIGLFINANDEVTIDKVVMSETEMYDVISDAIVDHKNEVNFRTTFMPDYVDFDMISNMAVTKDLYAGCEFFGIEYIWRPNADGYYHVNVELKDPKWIRSKLTKKRVKAICKKFRGFSDYEKVKAVHDYLILNNEYRGYEGGAYGAIIKGHSACNGYSLAFYAFMKELNIPVTNEFGDNHMWNSVCVDGKWYNIDLTWDDVNGVSYDYFLKCEAEWAGHDHGHSDAEVSLPVEGKNAEYYYKMVPYYKGLKVGIIAVVFVLFVGGVFVYIKISDERNKKVREERFDEFEQSMSAINDSIFVYTRNKSNTNNSNDQFNYGNSNYNNDNFNFTSDNYNLNNMNSNYNSVVNNTHESDFNNSSNDYNNNINTYNNVVNDNENSHLENDNVNNKTSNSKYTLKLHTDD